MNTIDSTELPSIGYGKSRNTDAAKENQRKWALWIYKKIVETVNADPRREELARVCARQQAALDAQADTIVQLTAKLDQAIADIQQLTTVTLEYRNWEQTISEHVADIDQKAGDVQAIRSLVYSLWDVSIQQMEPDVKKAERLIKAYRHLSKVGPAKRSRVDGEQLNHILSEQRWYNQDI